MTGVLIVDDQPDARHALRTIVSHTHGFDVIGEAVDGRDAIAQIARRRSDIVLMDVRMPRLDGLEATRLICRQPNPPAVIMMTTFDHDANVFGALQAGAAGFLLKTATVARVIDALESVAAGGGLIAPEVTRRLISRFTAIAPARPQDPTLDQLTRASASSSMASPAA